jgi:hypothetical protein
MKMTNLLLAIAIFTATGAPAQQPPARVDIVATGQIDSVVRIRDVRATDSELTGTLVNLTDDELRDVRLRVADMFLWQNERRPGVDDVSRSEEFIVKGPIAPRGAVAFTAPRSPLPVRSDGDFRTTAEVTSLTRQPVTAQAPAVPMGTPPAGAPPPAAIPSAPVTPPPVGTVTVPSAPAARY